MPGTRVPFPSQHFSIYELTDGVFAAIATDGGAAISNAGIIDLGGRTLVFDTFMTPQAARDLRLAAEQLTDREPELVVNSHYHNDHVWGNQVFTPRTLVLSTAQTLKLMQTAGRDELQWARDVSARRLEDARRQHAAARDEHQRRDAQMWMGYFGGLVEALPDLTVRFPDITFENRLFIHGSARSAELISFEHCHTGNDAILLLRDSGIVFMSDLLFVNCHPYLDEADVSKLRLVLQDITGTGATVFVPGHGPPGTAQEVATNISYIDMCMGTASDLISQGDTSEARIARETAPGQFANWALSRFYTANLSSLCSKLAGPQASP
jgi:glyoxylase-like metal-dependent hydrolase (beta-lactamase superfamily II)